jgi:A/G-specific adenine glycosylase
MPWRGIRDPYRIWVSEVMLQQTQVDTVRPYYAAFVRRFPSIAALAAARPDAVLAAWSGLGYYRRARHLHEAVRLVVREHGGRVPDDLERFGALPGVGRYTSGAVLSIAFDQPLPVLDGNVARVLSRLHGLRASVRDPRGARRLWAIAASLVPMRAPGDWNQALMEMGATVCLPRAPRCGECPIAGGCRALALGRPEAYPAPAARRAVERLRRAVVVIERAGKVLMTRRRGALLEGMWEPPGVDVPPGAAPGARLRTALARLGLRARIRDTGQRVRHVITHRAIEVEVWEGALPVAAPPPRAGRWIDPREGRVGLTALAARLASRRFARRT